MEKLKQYWLIILILIFLILYFILNRYTFLSITGGVIRCNNLTGDCIAFQPKVNLK